MCLCLTDGVHSDMHVWILIFSLFYMKDVRVMYV